jgi:CheY-like chemotaxis protein
MSAKRALVVDDSRSARAFLGRLLERHNLTVDTAESAEQAIDYLTQQRPDVIFMDHLMPGMDGLQAVRAIKNDPRTATIPILMYTSQDGELYLGQARALGAMGVLPKQTRPADVTKALVQLHLIGDETGARELTPAEADRALGGPTPAAAAANAARPALQALAPELQRVVTALLEDHSSEMRRFVVEHLESHADRIVGDLRAALKEEGAGATEAGAAPPRDTGRTRQSPRLLAVLAIVVVVLAGGLLWLWYQAISTQDQIAAQLRTAQEQLTATRSALADIQAQAAKAIAAAATGSAAAGDSMIELVPFGEQPLALGRVDKVQAQLELLLAQNFHGRVQIESFSGRYCLSGTGDASVLADPALPQAKCDSIGQPASQAGLSRESVSFANMLSSMKSRARGRISFSVETGSPVELAVNYPPPSDKLTAGEWNQAAAKNNRVEMHWYAEP